MKNEDVGREVVSYRDGSPSKKSVVANKEELAKLSLAFFARATSVSFFALFYSVKTNTFLQLYL